MARQARSLNTLLAEVNAAAPRRSKLSDGGLGDDAHASRASDHNPNGAGVWRARDFTHDPEDGLDCNVLARDLVALFGKHPAMGPGSNIIWNGRVISHKNLKLGWRTYTGANKHRSHLHLSVSTAASGYDSTAAWGVLRATASAAPAPTQEDEMLVIVKTPTDPTLWISNGVTRTRLASQDSWKNIIWLSQNGIQPVYGHGIQPVVSPDLWAFGYPVDVAFSQTLGAIASSPALADVIAKLDEMAADDFDAEGVDRLTKMIEALPPAIATEVGHRLTGASA